MRMRTDTIHMPSKIASINNTIELVRRNLSSASCVPLGVTRAVTSFEKRLFALMERTARMVDNMATVHPVAVQATTLLEHVITVAYAINLRMSEKSHPRSDLFHAQLRGATGLASYQIKHLYDKHDLSALLNIEEEHYFTHYMSR